MKIDIIYIENASTLRTMPVGSDVYYNGNFYHIARLHPVTTNSASCPCVNKKCAFLEDKRKNESCCKKDEDKICPMFHTCFATQRPDNESVVFTPYKPSKFQIDRLNLWLEKQGKEPVSYEEDN